MKAIVTPFKQIIGNSFAFTIQSINSKSAAFLQLRNKSFTFTTYIQKFGYERIFNIISDIIYIISSTRIKMINRFYTLSACLCFKLNRRVHIAHVLHSVLQVFTRKFCLQSIIDNWFFSNVFQCSVNPFCGICSCQCIGAKRNLEQREPLGISLLTNIVFKGVGVKFFRICFYFYTFENVMSILNKL